MEKKAGDEDLELLSLQKGIKNYNPSYFFLMQIEVGWKAFFLLFSAEKCKFMIWKLSLFQLYI